MIITDLDREVGHGAWQRARRNRTLTLRVHLEVAALLIIVPARQVVGLG
jgi:hypothetical protein